MAGRRGAGGALGAALALALALAALLAPRAAAQENMMDADALVAANASAEFGVIGPNATIEKPELFTGPVWEAHVSPYDRNWADPNLPNGPPANWIWIDHPDAAKPGEYSTEASLKRFLGIGNKTNYDVNTYPFGQMWQAKQQTPGNRTGLDVEVSVNFFKIFDVNQKSGKADLAVWLRQRWFDPRLVWDPENWEGTDTLYVWMGKGGPDGEIWSPDIELWNAETSIQDSLTKTYAVVKSNGEVKWSRPGRLKVMCNFYGLEKCERRRGGSPPPPPLAPARPPSPRPAQSHPIPPRPAASRPVLLRLNQSDTRGVQVPL